MLTLWEIGQSLSPNPLTITNSLHSPPSPPPLPSSLRPYNRTPSSLFLSLTLFFVNPSLRHKQQQRCQTWFERATVVTCWCWIFEEKCVVEDSTQKTSSHFSNSLWFRYFKMTLLSSWIPMSPLMLLATRFPAIRRLNLPNAAFHAGNEVILKPLKKEDCRSLGVGEFLCWVVLCCCRFDAKWRSSDGFHGDGYLMRFRRISDRISPLWFGLQWAVLVWRLRSFFGEELLAWIWKWHIGIDNLLASTLQ